MWLNGVSFLRYRGGLMYWADGIGVAEVSRQIAAWHQRYGERWAQPPCCAAWPKPARHCAKPNPAGRCSSGTGDLAPDRPDRD
jgi:hypothetical protein